MACQIEHDHWCDIHRPATGAGMGPGYFCSSPHPAYRQPQQTTGLDGNVEFFDAPTVFCRRPKRHDGDHAAYTFLISSPETWPNHDNEEPPF